MQTLLTQNHKKEYTIMKNRIKCDVENCVYHDGECECTADSISVDTSAPSDSCDAKCSTYKCHE